MYLSKNVMHGDNGQNEYGDKVLVIYSNTNRHVADVLKIHDFWFYANLYLSGGILLDYRLFWY